MRPRAGIVVLASIGVAIALSLLASRGGPGVSTDSVVYLEGARALKSGVGYVVDRGASRIPILHFPPLYSVTLATIGTVGKDSLSAALYLNLALRVVLLVIVWLGLRRDARLGLAATAIALAFLATSPELTDAGAWVLSEPLFFVLSTGALLLLTRHLQRPQRVLLVAASLLVAAAVLTRYAGVALLGAVPLCLLLWRRRSFGDRVLDIAIYASIVALPILAWTSHVLGSRGSFAGGAGRTINLHPPTPRDWHTGAGTLSHWLFPYAVPDVVGALLVLAIIGVALGLTLRSVQVDPTTPPEGHPLRVGRLAYTLVFMVTGFVYLATVILARSVVDAMIPFDGRMMSPAFIYFVIGTLTALGASEPLGVRFKRVGAVIATLLVASQARHAYYSAADVDHLGYTGKSYEVMARELAPMQSTVAYSNGTPFLRFHFASLAQALPSRYNPYSRTADPEFESEVRALCNDLARTRGTVLYLSAARHRSPWVPTLDELSHLGHLDIEARGEGWILLGPGTCN